MVFSHRVNDEVHGLGAHLYKVCYDNELIPQIFHQEQWVLLVVEASMLLIQTRMVRYHMFNSRCRARFMHSGCLQHALSASARS